MQGKPLAADFLKGIALFGLGVLALGARIRVIGDRSARFVSTFSRQLQWDVRIDAEREHLLVAVRSISEAPPL